MWRRSVCGLALVALLATVPASSADAATRTWANPPIASTGSGTGLDNVSCASPAFCVAVGIQQAESGTTSLVDLWNGVAWSEMSTPDLATVHSLGGVSCLTTSFCIAVGAQQLGGAGSDWAPLIDEWDGSSWATVPSPNTAETFNGLLAVSCVTTTSCVAVGSSAQDNTLQPLTEVWNGADWTIAADAVSGASAYLNAVSCTRPSFCIGVGQSYDPVAHTQQSLFQKWNGSHWSALPSPVQSSAEQTVVGVSCTSATWCLAVGNNFDGNQVATTYTWDGTSWSLTNIFGSDTIEEAFYNVDCLTRTRCVAVGYLRDSSRRRHAPPLPPLIESWNGVTWKITGKQHEPQLSDSLFGVSCSTVTDCAAVGYGYAGALGLVSE